MSIRHASAGIGLDNGPSDPINVFAIPKRSLQSVKVVEKEKSAGRIHWEELHAYPWTIEIWDSVAAEKYYDDWKLRIPNFGCSCSSDYELIDNQSSFDFGTPMGFFISSWKRHNAVNHKLQRKELSLLHAKMEHLPWIKDTPIPVLQPGQSWIIHAHALSCKHRNGIAEDTVFGCELFDRCTRFKSDIPSCSVCSRNSTYYSFVPVDDDFGSGDRLLVTIGTGERGKATLDIARPSLERYAERCGARFVALTNQTQLYWGLEKFRIHRAFETNSEVLYIDSDVVPQDHAPNLFELPYDVAIHDDWEKMPYDKTWLRPERREVYESQRMELPSTFSDRCLNSGIVLVKNQFGDVWKPPEYPLPSFHCAEQLLVEKRILDLDPRLYILPHELNWQAWFLDFDSQCDTVPFVHAACVPNKLSIMKAAAAF